MSAVDPYRVAKEKASDALALLLAAARSASFTDRAEKEETAERYLRQAADSVARARKRGDMGPPPLGGRWVINNPNWPNGEGEYLRWEYADEGEVA